MDNNSQNPPSRDWPSAPAGNQPLRPKPPVFPLGRSPATGEAQPPRPQTPAPSFNPPKPSAPSYPTLPSIPKTATPQERVVPPGMPTSPSLGGPAPRPMIPTPPSAPRPPMPTIPAPAPKIPIVPPSPPSPSAFMARQLPPMPPLNLPDSPSLGGPAVPVSRVSISELSPKKPITKILTTILVGLVVVGGIGSLTYFVILPTFFGAKTVTPKPTVSVGHASFFVNPAAASAGIKIPSLSALDIITALQNEAFKQLADQQIKEVSVADKNGQVDFSKFVAALSPALSAINLSKFLDSDFTGFMYYDSNGVWPGYVSKLKASADSYALKQALMQLTSATNLDSLYLTSPGIFQPFKDGQYKNYTTRYSVGSKTGASLNYAVIGDYLIVSTSFSGFKAALPLLGL